MPVGRATDEYDDAEDDVKKSFGSSSRHGGSGGRGGGKGQQAVAGPGLAPVYVSDPGLDRYSMKKGTRVSDIVAFKLLKKSDVMQDIEELRDQCDFYALKEAMEEYEGDTLLFIRGPENEFEYNYLWCSTLDSYEDHLQEMKEKGERHADKVKDAFGADMDGGGDGGEDADDDGDEYKKFGRGKGRMEKSDQQQEKTTIKRPVEILSDIEIATLQVKSHRPPLGFYISQSRFKFAKPVDFDDHDFGEKSAEYRRQKIPNYTDSKMTLEMGFQAAPKKQECATQTAWLNSVNKATQYAPVHFHTHEIEGILESPALLDFLRASEDLIVRELQTNETLDIFADEFHEFEDEEVSTLGNRLENNLEVYHSFTHPKYAWKKNINQVQWFPQAAAAQAQAAAAAQAAAVAQAAAARANPARPSASANAANSALNTKPHVSTLTSGANGNGTLVAFSCSNNVTFDQWVEQSGKVLTSSILIYSLQDVLHPFLVLEVPGNIQCFKVHPTHPEYIIGGLATGQVLFWDLTDAREKVKQYQQQQLVNQHAYNRASAAAAGQTTLDAKGVQTGTTARTALTDDSNATSTTGGAGGSSTESLDEIAVPPIKYTVLSYIDRSHSRPVSDLVWLPPLQQVNRRGEYFAAERGISSQFASVASDGRLLVWDFKNRNDGAASKQAAAAAQAAMGGPPTSLAAKVAAAAAEDPDAKEPKWAPIFSLPLVKSEQTATGAGGHGGVSTGATGGATGATSGSTGSGSGSNASATVGVSKLCLGEGTLMLGVTEDGEVVEIDWGARASEDRAKPDTIRSVIPRAHFQASTSVERSPHFPDVYLTAGDWTFAVWKVGVLAPVFTSACVSEYLAAARWSPTRPGIIVTARADGTIDVWDLVDQCHKASLNFPTGVKDPLSSLEFFQSKTSSQQYLAAGDIGGRLHIIEVPRNLRRKIANEENLMRLFYEREIARAQYCKRRRELRQAKQAQAQAKNKQVVVVAPEDAANGAPGAATAAQPASAAAAAARAGLAGDDASKSLDPRETKEKAEKLRQLEEEKAEKEYQRLFDLFKSTLAPEDMR